MFSLTTKMSESDQVRHSMILAIDSNGLLSLVC